MGTVLSAILAQGPSGAFAVQTLLQSVAKEKDIPTENNIDPAPSKVLNIESHDVSELIAIRFENQSRESAMSVRAKGRRGGEDLDQGDKPTTSSQKQPSERQLFTKRIYEVIRLESEQGSSTGLNRHVRHTTEATNTTTDTGNVANAKAAAQTAATKVSERKFHRQHLIRYLPLPVGYRTKAKTFCQH